MFKSSPSIIRSPKPQIPPRCDSVNKLRTPTPTPKPPLSDDLAEKPNALGISCHTIFPSGPLSPDQSSIITLLQDHTNLRAKVASLESVLERCFTVVQSLKHENIRLSEESQTYREAYSHSQEDLDYLLRNLELFLKDPNGYYKVRDMVLRPAHTLDVGAEWARAHWISTPANEARLAEVLIDLHDGHDGYIRAAETIDTRLRELNAPHSPADDDAHHVFLRIDYNLLKSLVQRGLQLYQGALDNTRQAIALCSAYLARDGEHLDLEINYLAKAKYFHAKCLQANFRSLDMVSEALQCAGVFHGEGAEAVAWRALIESELAGLTEGESGAIGKGQGQEYAMKTKRHVGFLADRYLARKTTSTTTVSGARARVMKASRRAVSASPIRGRSLSTSSRSSAVLGFFRKGKSVGFVELSEEEYVRGVSGFEL